eukprot:GHVS01051759.1.p1 GENE.GHVS01051759.1~~GHVS01051759.1.p1  ORF type:complete len:411 (-),score=71.32 GHVS01051759.1:150-1382(-)
MLCTGFVESMMGDKPFDLFVGHNYAEHINQLLAERNSPLKNVLHSRRMPEEGLDELTIEAFLTELSAADSNNRVACVGVGEREGRVHSRLVRAQHRSFAHGIGRSGDLLEVQPKALGSSILNQLANCLVKDAIRIAGVACVSKVCVLPVCTGLAMTLCIGSIRNKLKHKQVVPDVVIWSRIDQKSCLKAIIAAGCQPDVVELKQQGDMLVTDVDAIRGRVAAWGERALCVVTTTSTFAPRVPDDVAAVATICKELAVAHIVNNAYGLQCSRCCHLIEQGSRCGRVDLFVQSTDKNFMVPVGGAVVASSRAECVEAVSQLYPGRASSVPSRDVLTTLLSLGVAGWRAELKKRKQLFEWFAEKMAELANQFDMRMLNCPQNKISMALCLDSLCTSKNSEMITALGSMLFYRG